MRTFVRLLALLCFAAVSLGPTSASAAATPSAKGGGILINVRFAFDAHIAHDGAPSGRFSVTFPGEVHASGPVTCLVVVGNTATIAGPIDAGFSPDDDILPITDEYAFFFVEDNGPPEEGVSPDEISPFFAVLDTPANPCPPPPPDAHPTRTLAQGNIIVRGG